jgi:hypothetical protein
MLLRGRAMRTWFHRTQRADCKARIQLSKNKKRPGTLSSLGTPEPSPERLTTTVVAVPSVCELA